MVYRRYKRLALYIGTLALLGTLTLLMLLDVRFIDILPVQHGLALYSVFIDGPAGAFEQKVAVWNTLDIPQNLRNGQLVLRTIVQPHWQDGSSAILLVSPAETLVEDFYRAPLGWGLGAPEWVVLAALGMTVGLGLGLRLLYSDFKGLEIIGLSVVLGLLGLLGLLGFLAWSKAFIGEAKALSSAVAMVERLGRWSGLNTVVRNLTLPFGGLVAGATGVGLVAVSRTVLLWLKQPVGNSLVTGQSMCITLLFRWFPEREREEWLGDFRAKITEWQACSQWVIWIRTWGWAIELSVTHLRFIVYNIFRDRR